MEEILKEIRECMDRNRDLRTKSNATLSKVESLILNLDREAKEAREAGRNEAWEVAKKINLTPDLGGMDFEELNDLFESSNHFEAMINNSATEAIDKYNAWIEKKKQAEEEIDVGDEVVFKDGRKAIVMAIVMGLSNNSFVLYSRFDGLNAFSEEYAENIKKTGRHVDLSILWEE